MKDFLLEYRQASDKVETSYVEQAFSSAFVTLRSLCKGRYGPYDKKTQYDAVVGSKDRHTDLYKATEDTAKFRFGHNLAAQHVPIKCQEREEWCNFSSRIQMLLVHDLMTHLFPSLRSITTAKQPIPCDMQLIRAIFWRLQLDIGTVQQVSMRQNLMHMSNVNTRGCIRSITVGGDGQTVNILHARSCKCGKMVDSSCFTLKCSFSQTHFLLNQCYRSVHYKE